MTSCPKFFKNYYIKKERRDLPAIEKIAAIGGEGGMERNDKLQKDDVR